MFLLISWLVLRLVLWLLLWLILLSAITMAIINGNRIVIMIWLNKGQRIVPKEECHDFIVGYVAGFGESFMVSFLASL